MHFILLQLEPVNEKLQGIYPSLSNLCTALCGVFGLVTAVKIYQKWQTNSRMHISAEGDVLAWGGAAVFFLIAKVVIDVIIF